MSLIITPTSSLLIKIIYNGIIDSSMCFIDWYRQILQNSQKKWDLWKLTKFTKITE